MCLNQEWKRVIKKCSIIVNNLVKRTDIEKVSMKEEGYCRIVAKHIKSLNITFYITMNFNGDILIGRKRTLPYEYIVCYNIRAKGLEIVPIKEPYEKSDKELI
jgi:hypothetical protein